MKALIVYDSAYGNTEQIAQAIGSAFPSSTLRVSDPSGNTVRVVLVKEATAIDLEGIDLFIAGSPTQAGRGTEIMQKFLDAIPAGKLRNVSVAAFDTRINVADVSTAIRVVLKAIGFAAEKTLKALQEKGGQAVVEPEGFYVYGKEGPLKDGELDRARKWGQEIFAKLAV